MIQLMGPLKRKRTSKVMQNVITRQFLRLMDYIGEYKTILQLVGVLSHGKVAKRLTDRSIDLMQDVQNLRKAIYECVYSYLLVYLTLLTAPASYKLKTEACEKGSAKERNLRNITVNYLCVFHL